MFKIISVPSQCGIRLETHSATLPCPPSESFVCRIDEYSGHEVCAFYDNEKLRRGFYLILVGITSVVLLLEIAIYVKYKGAEEIDLYGENDIKRIQDQE